MPCSTAKSTECGTDFSKECGMEIAVWLTGWHVESHGKMGISLYFLKNPNLFEFNFQISPKNTQDNILAIHKKLEKKTLFYKRY